MRNSSDPGSFPAADSPGCLQGKEFHRALPPMIPLTRALSKHRHGHHGKKLPHLPEQPASLKGVLVFFYPEKGKI